MEYTKTILLFKKRDRQLLQNYKPITLLSQMYKLFRKIKTLRIAKKWKNRPIQQAGFREEYCTYDYVLTIRILIEKVNEFNMALYFLFTKRSSIQSSIGQLLHNISDKAVATIELHSETNSVPINPRVREGNTINPGMFSPILEDKLGVKSCQWRKAQPLAVRMTTSY